jgi:hypothetical protein
VRADEYSNGEGARRLVFYPGHGDAAGVRKIEGYVDSRPYGYDHAAPWAAATAIRPVKKKLCAGQLFGCK